MTKRKWTLREWTIAEDIALLGNTAEWTMTDCAVAETVWLYNDNIIFCELATLCVMYRANCN